MKIRIGTKLNWNSAAGNLTGVVTNIFIALNAADEMVAWISLKNLDEKFGTTTLCGTDNNLKMLNVREV